MASLLTHTTAATMTAGSDFGLIPDAAVVIDGTTIAWIGPTTEIPPEYRTLEPRDQQGRLVTPAPIDCHTHLIFGGHRAAEFELRLQGATYEEIARAGGGILSTVTATRAASEAALIATALPRLDAILAEGTSTVEIKSGYGLDIETELKMLRAARALATLRPVRIKTTFLAAHATPPEFKSRPDDYIGEICLPALHAAHAEGLIDAVDGFCENIAFTPAQIDRLFTAAKALGLPVKLHAEQLSHQGGTLLAARHTALSADHVEYATEADARALKAAGTVAVILPGAFYTIRETQLPPIAAFRGHGVPMALATDCNPGSSPLTSLLLTMNMACTLFRLTPAEALAGITRNAATALGLSDTGTLAPGKRADIAIWNASHPAELAYRIGFNPLHSRMFAGQP